MNSELLLFHKQVTQCKTPEDLFGTDASQVKKLYRRFAHIAHEDKYTRSDEKRLATIAFSLLNGLHQLALERITAGIYGQPIIFPRKSSTPPSMQGRRGTYVVKDLFAEGDISSIFSAELEGTTSTLLKVSDHPSYNLFLSVEATTLQHLNAKAEGIVSYTHFVPTLLESLKVRIEADPAPRIANVFNDSEGFRGLPEVAAQYPEGVDPRHFVWIFNRLLTTLSFTHSAGIIHGAILPSHILIHPTTHAIRLVDWCFSGARGKHAIPALSKGYEGFYPPEVKQKTVATPATDLYMSAMTMCYVLGADYGIGLEGRGVPAKFGRLLESCLLANPYRRPQSAWELFKEVQSTAEEVFGPRKYVELQMT